MKKRLLSHIALGALVLGLSTGLSGCGFRIIDSGERGVKTTFGKASKEVLAPGLRWKWPLIQGITIYDVRVQKVQQTTSLFSSDVQETKVDYALNYSLDPERVPEIYQKYGTKKQLEEVLLDPATSAALKDTMGQYKAEDMIAKREKAAKGILERLKNDMQEGNEPIQIKDFTLKDIDFSDKFENAVEEKVVAAQKALTEKNIIEQQKAKNEQEIVKAEAEAKQVTIKAEAEAQRVKIQAQAEADKIALVSAAEAKAIELQGEAIAKNPEVLQLRKIEKWTGSVPTFVSGDNGNSIVPMVDVMKMKQAKEMDR